MNCQETEKSFKAGAWVFLLVSSLLLCIIGFMAKPFIVSLIAGGMMALALNPWFRILQQKMSSHIAAAFATFSLALLVILPMLALAFVALRDATALTSLVSADTSGAIFKTWWSHWRQTFEGTAQTYAPWIQGVDFEGQALLAVKKVIDWISSTVIKIAGETPALILQLTMGILSCYFFLVDGKRFISWFKSLLPLSSSIQTEIAAAFRDATRATLMASLAAALAQSAIVVISFVSMGIPAAALATGLTFVFAWIPVLGSAPIFLLAGIWAAAKGAWIKVVLLLIASVITGLIDNFIRPMVLKGGSDIHPLVSLVAILGGIEFFGLLGVLLGPVIVAMFLACMRVWPHLAKEAGWMQTQPQLTPNKENSAPSDSTP